MKNGLSRNAVNRIATSLGGVFPEFNRQQFTKDALNGIETLELKARVTHIINAIHTQLPEFNVIANRLCALPTEWDAGDPDDALRGFAAWPIIDYVGTHGLSEPTKAFKVLEHLTPLFSAEFAIRPFIVKHPNITFKQLGLWTKHPNDHVRRLASEGSRPRLPWGLQLKSSIQDPSPAFAILEALKNDPSLYVRKSVANHLNDISKDHPSLMLDIAEQWLKNATPETQWIVKHACRSLIKQGDSKALALMGAGTAKITDITLNCAKGVKAGEALNFKVSLKSLSDQQLVIDYAIDFLRGNGNLNRKVFKLKTLPVTQQTIVSLNKSYSFKPITTRRYYSGEHWLHIQVNGSIVASQRFWLS